MSTCTSFLYKINEFKREQLVGSMSPVFHRSNVTDEPLANSFTGSSTRETDEDSVF